MNAKDQFLSQKTLAEWWASIAGDSKFDAVMLHAQAVALETCPSAEQREGVLTFKDILLTISHAEAKTPKFAKPGINHNLDIPSRTAKPKKTDNKK